MSKCVSHINGYEIKDAAARSDIEDLIGEVARLSNRVSAPVHYVDCNNLIHQHRETLQFHAIVPQGATVSLEGLSMFIDDYYNYKLQSPIVLSTGSSINLTLTSDFNSNDITLKLSYISITAPTQGGAMYINGIAELSYADGSYMQNSFICSGLLKVV